MTGRGPDLLSVCDVLTQALPDRGLGWVPQAPQQVADGLRSRRSFRAVANADARCRSADSAAAQGRRVPSRRRESPGPSPWQARESRGTAHGTTHVSVSCSHPVLILFFRARKLSYFVTVFSLSRNRARYVFESRCTGLGAVRRERVSFRLAFVPPDEQARAGCAVSSAERQMVWFLRSGQRRWW